MPSTDRSFMSSFVHSSIPLAATVSHHHYRLFGTQPVVPDVAEMQEGGVVKIVLESGLSQAKSSSALRQGKDMPRYPLKAGQHTMPPHTRCDRTQRAGERTGEARRASESMSLHWYSMLHTPFKIGNWTTTKKHNCFDLLKDELGTR